MTSLPLSCIIMNFFVSEMDALEQKYGMERGMRSGMPLVVCSVVKQLYRFFHLVTAWLYTSANTSALLPTQFVVPNRYLKLHTNLSRVLTPMKGKITILMFEHSQFYSTNIHYFTIKLKLPRVKIFFIPPPIPAVRGVVPPASRRQRLYASPRLCHKNIKHYRFTKP